MSPDQKTHAHRSTIDHRAHARVASYLGRLARRSVRRGKCPSTPIEVEA